MTTVTRTFAVNPRPEVVLNYLKGFSHAPEWDPGTESCSRNDEGPIEVGANWHDVSKIAGITTELTYTLKKLSDDNIVLVGINDTATSTENITITPAGLGSSITYEATVEMNGLAKLAAPAVKLIFEKLGNETEENLTDILNALAS